MALSFVSGATTTSLKSAVFISFFGALISTLMLITFAEYRHSMLVSNTLSKIFGASSGVLFICAIGILVGAASAIAGALGYWHRQSYLSNRVPD